MANIGTAIEMYDKLSAPINNMIGAINNMIGAYHKLDGVMDKGFDPGQIREAEVALTQAKVQVDQLGDYIRKNEQQQENFNDEVEDGSLAMDGLVNKVMGLAGAYLSIKGVTDFISSAMEGSNLESSITAQLKNVLKNVGATQNAFEELQEESAKFESEGMYGAAEMLAGAGELATYISDTDAIKSMMGTLADYATGMSGGGALNSDQIVEYGTQLGKALMGTYDGLKKKGFELTDIQKEIIDGTATHAEIAEELGLTIDEVTSMSEDMHKALVLDSVIAESWDGLYESMSNTPEGQISMLQNAWGDVMDSVGHQVTPAVMDLFKTIRENMPEIKNTILGITSALGVAIGAVTLLIDNWSIIAPIIGAVATAVGLYTTALLVNNVVQWVSNTAKTIGAITAVAHGAAITEEMLATTGMTKAQLAFNAALYASPITWILLIIIAVIAAIYAIVAAINKVTGSTLSATGLIVGTLMAAVSVIWNLFLTLVSLIIQNAVLPLTTAWDTFANFFGNILNDPAATVIRTVENLATTVLGILQTIANGIDAIFGSNLSGIVQGWMDKVSSKADALVDKYGNGTYEEKSNVTEQVQGLLNNAQTSLSWDTTSAFGTGYSWGKGIGASVSNAMDGFGGLSGYDESQIPSNIAETAGNTGKAADSLEITNEDLKYLRDIAERDAVNRFTTAEIKVEMTNNNNINGGMDLDGIVDYLTNGVNEAMEKAAEGVHA